jgi:predicted dehydrogenase
MTWASSILGSRAAARRAATPSSPLRIAVVGCGAIAETYHLPALARHATLMNRVVLVDPDVSRARALAERFSAADVADNHEAVLERIDAAIIAAPPSLHHRIAMPLLARGIHVLCEKPLAESSGEAIAMIVEAERSGAHLCVNNTRRVFPALQKAQQLLQSGAIGECIGIEHTEGVRFNWPSVSGWHFAASGARGVLLDQGAHVLDTICWWLGGRPAVLSCATDSFGGPEGFASVVLQRAACTVKVKLTWLAKLSNTYRITGTRGVVEGNVSDWRRLTITSGGRRRQLKVSSDGGDYLSFGNLIVDNFVDVVHGRAAALVPAAAVLPSIQLLEECYRRASRMPMPWVDTLPHLHVRAS